MRFFDLTKIGLAVALIAAFITFVENPNQPPVNDPWFMPVILVMLWTSLKN